MTNPQTWTNQQLIQLSNSLANAYSPGLSSTNSSARSAWTPEKLIHLSRSLGQAYHPNL